MSDGPRYARAGQERRALGRLDEHAVPLEVARLILERHADPLLRELGRLDRVEVLGPGQRRDDAHVRRARDAAYRRLHLPGLRDHVRAGRVLAGRDCPLQLVERPLGRLLFAYEDAALVEEARAESRLVARLQDQLGRDDLHVRDLPGRDEGKVWVVALHEAGREARAGVALRRVLLADAVERGV